MLKLFYAPGTCALATHIVLEEVGADYEMILIDLAKGEQTGADYLSVNPKGRVPALITPQGVLTETPALLVYLAQCFPEARMAPLQDPFAFARLQEFNSFICSTLHIAHAHRMRGHRWVDDEAAIRAMQRKVPETVGAAWSLIEDHMFQGPWAMGQHYTVADAYLFAVALWMEGDGIDPRSFPKVHGHRERMQGRVAVQQALEMQSARTT